MRTLLVAIGNRLRRDDGAAHRVLELLECEPGVERLPVLQLTPERASDIASFDRVVFIDADSRALTLLLEAAPPASPALSHASAPAEIVELARALYGFSGQAMVCRIPASDFSAGEGLSPQAEAHVREAADRLQSMLK